MYIIILHNYPNYLFSNYETSIMSTSAAKSTPKVLPRTSKPQPTSLSSFHKFVFGGIDT